MRHCFVILHYLAEDVTVKCVNTLLDTFGSGVCDIVVVDNGSPDGSGPRLKERFDECERIHFVILEHNLGFARGNNEGYRYALEHCNPDFVVVMNNDVMIGDKNFLKGIEAEYETKPFAVLGPDIYSPYAGIHQSPTRLVPMTIHEAKVLKKKFKLKHKFFAYKYITWNLKLLLHIAREPHPVEKDPSHPHEGCVLHGACYIFSRDFTAVRTDAFNPATFLYCEEDILEYECRTSGLVMRYSPALKVNHLEDASTKAAFKSDMKRQKMKYGRLIESFEVFIALMERNAQ